MVEEEAEVVEEEVEVEVAVEVEVEVVGRWRWEAEGVGAHLRPPEMNFVVWDVEIGERLERRVAARRDDLADVAVLAVHHPRRRDDDVVACGEEERGELWGCARVRRHIRDASSCVP